MGREQQILVSLLASIVNCWEQVMVLSVSSIEEFKPSSSNQIRWYLEGCFHWMTRLIWKTFRHWTGVDHGFFLAFFGSAFQFLKRKINIHCESFPTLWAWSTENQYGYQSKSQYTIFSSILHDNNSIARLIGSSSVVSQCWNKWTVYLSGIKGRKHGPISRRSWSNKWIISRSRDGDRCIEYI